MVRDTSVQQCGVHHHECSQQALVTQPVVDYREELRRQHLHFEQISEAKNCDLVGQQDVTAQAGELPEQRNVVQRLFHRRVARRKSLLHEVNAQHGLNRKR